MISLHQQNSRFYGEHDTFSDFYNQHRKISLRRAVFDKTSYRASGSEHRLHKLFAYNKGYSLFLILVGEIVGLELLAPSETNEIIAISNDVGKNLCVCKDDLRRFVGLDIFFRPKKHQNNYPN